MAPQAINDVRGGRGESLFHIAITDYRNFPQPLFRAHFLGEKCPDVDHVVILEGASGVFFVQVKTTAGPLTVKSIKVRLTNQDRNQLAQVPGPTYLVGVHEPSKRCFIRSIDRSTITGITSIPIVYELNAANLQTLYDEVKKFWAARTFKPNKSAFA